MMDLFLLSWGVHSYLQSFSYNENIVLVNNTDSFDSKYWIEEFYVLHFIQLLVLTRYTSNQACLTYHRKHAKRGRNFSICETSKDN
jgi:hypothetical protein